MTMATRTLKTAAELVGAGLIAPSAKMGADKVAERYAIALTPVMAALVDRADANDPIARQFIPALAEMEIAPGETADPIGDAAHSPVPGIVHRYPDRVLLKLLLTCPVYCRFCFRREFVGQGEGMLAPDAIEAALGYIRGRPEIWEVILTGGDPLMLSARRLKDIAGKLAAIPHVKIIRLHSRVPVADPGRLTPALVAALRAPGAATYVAVHANHAREFSAEARIACARLADAGIVLLGQSVLLSGVNDAAETLAALFRAMAENRIKPYYLHHPDLAPGTAHFRVPLERGQALMRELQGNVSGLCQPSYVLDIPGGFGKAPVGPAYAGQGQVTDFQGRRHTYPPDGAA